MGRTHTYRTVTTWTGNLGHGTTGYRSYERALETRAEGRPALEGSSDPTFRGDPARWNPELLLVASLSQCHLLWYLSLCATSGVVVLDYADDAVGEMVESADGGGHFQTVTLRPRVVVAAADMIGLAESLHDEAAAKCFIAASVNFPVRHEPVTTARAEPGAVAVESA